MKRFLAALTVALLFGLVVITVLGGVAFGVTTQPPTGGTTFNVRDFGATGNGTSNDTAAFERAMAQAAQVGGVVYVPAPGNYRIANVTPPSNTRLQVQAGASLKM
jgi:polygalacturonase